MNEEGFELLNKIGFGIVARISEDWDELQIVAEIDNDLSLFEASFRTPGRERKSIDVGYEVAQQFEELRALDAMSRKGKCTKCTLIVARDGQLRTDFSYDEPPRM